jgi:hypothetical protein
MAYQKLFFYQTKLTRHYWQFWLGQVLRQNPVDGNVPSCELIISANLD